LNIRQLEELPTAQEFAARQREQAWLAEQAEKEREASEQERLRRMAENQQRWAEERRQREEAKQRREQERAAKREAKVRQKAGDKRSRVALVVVAVGVLMLAGGGTAAYVLLSDDGSAKPSRAGTSPVPPPSPESRTGEPDPDRYEPADEGDDCSPAEGIAPPNLFPVEGARDAITLEATATSCDTATQFAESYFPAETSQGVTPGEPVDIEGFTCIQTQGSGGSTVECNQGGEQVTFRVGDATVVPQGYEYCPMYETRGSGVFAAGVRGVECSEAEDVLEQTVQTDAVVGDWTCDKEELSVCTSADLAAEIRYRISVIE
jgi:mannose-6-phosphate isomerase-like protein (cupin superfamily)